MRGISVKNGFIGWFQSLAAGLEVWFELSIQSVLGQLSTRLSIFKSFMRGGCILFCSPRSCSQERDGVKTLFLIFPWSSVTFTPYMVYTQNPQTNRKQTRINVSHLPTQQSCLQAFDFFFFFHKDVHFETLTLGADWNHTVTKLFPWLVFCHFVQKMEAPAMRREYIYRIHLRQHQGFTVLDRSSSHSLAYLSFHLNLCLSAQAPWPSSSWCCTVLAQHPPALPTSLSQTTATARPWTWGRYVSVRLVSFSLLVLSQQLKEVIVSPLTHIELWHVKQRGYCWGRLYPTCVPLHLFASVQESRAVVARPAVNVMPSSSFSVLIRS